MMSAPVHSRCAGRMVMMLFGHFNWCDATTVRNEKADCHFTGRRWMPRRRVPMKDGAGHDRPWVGASSR